jgi:hypothetical protein
MEPSAPAIATATAGPGRAPEGAPDPRPRIRFDRNELSGAFGDLGTDFPLLASMILIAGLDTSAVFFMFGALQIFTGLTYGLPMPVQPLKAMAVIVITQRLSADVLYGGGLAIGVLMLLLTATGLVDLLSRAVPKVVVRGIQFGLGLQLATLALREYLPAEGTSGYLLGGLAFVAVLLLMGNRRFPPAPFIVGFGVLFALFFKVGPGTFAGSVGFTLPQPQVPNWDSVLTGFLLLAIPQIPLSLGNSILATKQIVSDFFPGRQISARKIGFTYSLMNLVNPFFGGVPTCHGSGGVAGHYAFGGRTGGSVIIAGAFYLSIGLFLSAGFDGIVHLFPKPVLAVILFFEALALLALIRDVAGIRADLMTVCLIGAIAATVPYGYVVALVVGMALVYGRRWIPLEA